MTCNGEVVGFTTGNSFSDAKADNTYYVQAVNEYGGLSAKAKAGTSEGIGIVVSQEATTTSAVYSIDGRRQNSMLRGINIVRMSNGTARKVIE